MTLFRYIRDLAKIYCKMSNIVLNLHISNKNKKS